MKSARVYDVGIGWADTVERPFVETLARLARARKLSFVEITLETLARDLARTEEGAFAVRTYLDRGFLESFGFARLAGALEKSGARVINSPRAVLRSSGKADLYPLLKAAGLPLPRTHIFTARTEKRALDRAARSLGKPFVIVSSYGLGDAETRLRLTAEDGAAMRDFAKDNYADAFLAHEYVQPAVLAGKTAWFRPIYACGAVIPLWWDPLSNYYRAFGQSRAERELAEKLEAHMQAIHAITGLDLFSSEFAVSLAGELFLIDYANTPIDLNSSKKISGGLPSAVLARIADAILAVK